MKKYVVQGRLRDEIDHWTEMKSAKEILDRLDMADCYDEDLCVWESTALGELVPLTLHGTRHDHKNPLYIKATRPDGSIAFDGYGTDH